MISSWRTPFQFSVIVICSSANFAHANPDDALRLSASYSVTMDDNLFRLPAGTNTQSVLGRSSGSEVLKSSVAGISFTKDYGLQSVDLRASAVNYDYQNFSYLNFSAYNYSGRLQWSLTPRFTGVLAADRTQSLVRFEDFRVFTTRNERIATNERLEGMYELDGAWRLTGILLRNNFRGSAPVIEQRAFTRESIGFGLKRVSESGSELEYRVRRGTGDYTDVSFSAASFLPSGFYDIENEVLMRWNVTPKSYLTARISYLQKTFNQFSFRDYSGFGGNISAVGSLTSRLSFLLGASRQLSDYQSTYSNSIYANRLYIGSTWQIQEKLAIKIRREHTKSNFDGAVAGIFAADQRKDTSNLSRISLEWQPDRFMEITGWLQRDSRKSNYRDFGFEANSVGVTGQISF